MKDHNKFPRIRSSFRRRPPHQHRNHEHGPKMHATKIVLLHPRAFEHPDIWHRVTEEYWEDAERSKQLKENG